MASPNPQDTSGRIARNAPSKTFPVGEDSLHQVALRFVKYSRFQNQDAPDEETTSVLFLPMPVSIPENMNIRSDTHDLGAVDLLAEGIEQRFSIGAAPLSDVMKRIASNAYGAIKDDPKTAIGVLAAIAPGAKDTNTAKQLQITTGKVLNPQTTSFFDGVSLRQFNLSWRFSPRSLDESNALNDIYREIEMRIHPEELAEGLVLDYPDLVYVDFLGDSAKYLPKYRKAFISSVQRSHNPNFYKSGAPVEMELSISFGEIETITRNVLRGETRLSDVNLQTTSDTPVQQA